MFSTELFSQAALTPVQCSDAVDPTGGPYFAIDMYTLPGWISVAIGILCFILFLPGTQALIPLATCQITGRVI